MRPLGIPVVDVIDTGEIIEVVLIDESKFCIKLLTQQSRVDFLAIYKLIKSDISIEDLRTAYPHFQKGWDGALVHKDSPQYSAWQSLAFTLLSFVILIIILKLIENLLQ